MILPPWLSPRLIGAGVVVVALASSHVWAYRAGGARVKQQWDAAAVAAERLANEQRAEDARLSARSAAALQQAQAAIQAELDKTKEALDAELDRPTASCPRTAGDAVVPSSVWLRLQAIDDAGSARAAGAKPGR